MAIEKWGPQGVHKFYCFRQNARFLLFPFSSTLFERNDVNIKRVMCVCVYIYIYIYIYVCMYVCMYVLFHPEKPVS